MRHHHKTFKKEERNETTLILDRFSSTSLINQNRDSNESMKALQSQYFNTVERMRARTVQNNSKQLHPYHYISKNPEDEPRFGSATG